MFSKRWITESTEPYSAQINRLKQALDMADAVIVGAGSGISSSAGLTYSGRRFEEHFADFIAKYHLRDMYSAGFYPYPSLEEYWAYWSRHISVSYTHLPGCRRRDNHRHRLHRPIPRHDRGHHRPFLAGCFLRTVFSLNPKGRRHQPAAFPFA